jgi:putative membrane protein
MTRTLTFAAGAGLLLAVGLVATQGFAAVGDAFASIGWGVAVIVALRLVQVVGAGASWWALLPASTRVPARVYVLLRWVRESINTLLPVAQVGGDLVGARLLSFYGVEGGLAGASILVDLLTQTATQFVFSLVGLGLLMTRGGHETVIAAVSAGLGLMALGVVAFFFAQRWGGFRMIERGLLKLAENPSWKGLAGAANLHDRIELIHDDIPRMTAAFVLHLVMWFVGALEIWVALTCMGIETDMAQALVIESLGHAVRAAGFLVPGAIGIQEGGFIALCAIYGIPAPAALALSLVKRVPEIVLGLPGLLYWHRLEALKRELSHPAMAASKEAKPS